MNSARGATLLEMMILIALVIVVGEIGMSVNLDAYRSQAFQSERDLMRSLVLRARSLSLNGTCSVSCAGARAHGFHYDASAHTYTLFEGDSYSTRYLSVDAVFPASAAYQHSGATDLVFAPLSATASPSTLTIQNMNGHESNVSAGTEGQITWTD